MANIRPLETEITKFIAAWLDLQKLRCLWTHIPNEQVQIPRKFFRPKGGFDINAMIGAQRKKMGVRSGVPDLMFVGCSQAVPIAFYEIKRKGQGLSKTQIDWHKKCIAAGVACCWHPSDDPESHISVLKDLLKKWGALK